MYSIFFKILFAVFFAAFVSLTSAQNLTYIVQENETLSEILVAQGFPESYQLLSPVVEETIDLNPHIFFIPNPDLLSPGDELILPVNPFPRIAIQLETEAEILGIIEPAARVVVTKGTYLLERQGIIRNPSSENTAFVGDTVTTQDESVVRIQFTDESVFSLGSNSRFLIEEYVYAEERPVNGFRAKLHVLLGAVSGISGRIGEDESDFHSINTPISTIGLRGTEYTIRHCEEDCGDLQGTSLAVTEGAVAIANEVGEQELNENEFIQAASTDELSPVTDIPPGFLDLEADPANLEVEFTWWQRFLALFR